MLSLDELRTEVESGTIDTVVVAFTDMQGRLLGKRLHAEFFVEEASYLHAVPKELRGVAVLTEPLTIAEKSLREGWDKSAVYMNKWVEGLKAAT